MTDPGGVPAAIDAFERAIAWLARLLLFVSATACAAIFVLITASVLLRYGLAMPLRFTEELSGLLLAQAVFLALPWTLVSNSNIRVTLVADRLGAVGARVAWFLGQTIILAFLAVFLWQAWSITRFTLQLQLKAEVSRVVLGPWMVAMCATLVLCFLISLWQLVRPPHERTQAL